MQLNNVMWSDERELYFELVSLLVNRQVPNHGGPTTLSYLCFLKSAGCFICQAMN